MADGFDGFDGRYDLGVLEFEITKKSDDDTTPLSTDAPSNAKWLDQDDRPSLASFQPYKAASFESKGRTIRINFELYKALFQGNTNEDDVLYQKKPGKIIVRHFKPKFWNPLTWDKGFRVHMLPGSAGQKNFPNGRVNQYVSTIGFNSGMIDAVARRTNPDTGFVKMLVMQGKTPVWRYIFFQHPSEGINLSVIFLYVSTIIAIVFGLVGDAYHWSQHFRGAMDSCDHWIRSHLHNA